MEQTECFSAIAGNQKIDADAGIISGVSVITEGECAGKHKGTFVDSKTLSQLLSLASDFKDGVKVKLSKVKEHDGSVGAIVGSLKNFRIDGSQLRADLHLLKTDENFAKILEMSAKMPEDFGLSVVVPSNYEKRDGKQFLRPTDLFSVDLVEEPAANKTGLFSAKESMSEIKYKNGKDGDHDGDCMCKDCTGKKSMSQFDEAGLITKLSASFKTMVDSATAGLTAKLTEVETKLAKHDTDAAAVALSAKKTEIAGLVADATREGKVIPLTDEQMASMPIDTLKAMFSKLPSGQVKLSGTRKISPPKTADGKPVVFETADKRVEFCREKQAEGAAQLTAAFLADSSLGLTGLTRN